MAERSLLRAEDAPDKLSSLEDGFTLTSSLAKWYFAGHPAEASELSRMKHSAAA